MNNFTLCSLKSKYFSLSLLILCIQFAISNLLYPQTYKFKQLTADDGLSQNTILSIIQDKRGFIWFGTNNGLNRYDGYKFKVFKHNKNDSASISSSEITTLYEDRKGNLWVGTGNGLNLFNRDNETFTRFFSTEDWQTISDNYIHQLAEDEYNNLWVATGYGINKYNFTSSRFKRFVYDEEYPSFISDKEIYSIAFDEFGYLWIATWGDGVIKYNPKTDESIIYQHDQNDPNSLSSDEVWSVFIDKENELWIGTWKGGLNKYNRATDNFISYKNIPSDPFSLSNNYVRIIYETSKGDLLIGTDGGGLNIFNREQDNFSILKHKPSDLTSISEDGIESIYEDKSGELWIGTWGGGVNHTSVERSRIEHFKHDYTDPNSLSQNEVRALHVDHESNGRIIWIGTDGGGLNMFDRNTGQFVRYRSSAFDPNSISDDVVLSIFEDSKNNLWIGTYTGGLNKFDKKTKKFKAYKHDPKNSQSIGSDFVREVCEDNFGVLWIATIYGGLNRFDPKTEIFKSYKVFSEEESLNNNVNDLNTIYKDRDGNLWIGSWNDGLFKFRPTSDKNEKISFTEFKNDPNNPNSINDDLIFSILQGAEGEMWVGTRGGLNRYDPKTKLFSQFDEKRGLSNNNIYGILQDSNNNLWLSNDRGITKFNPKNQEYRIYTVNDGLQSNEFYQGAYYKNVNGEFLFGGNNGFNIFHPDSLRDNKYVPQIVLTDIKIQNESVKIRNERKGISSLKKSVTESKHLELAYSDHAITIEFASLHFTNPSNNKYAYMLEGFDEKWTRVGNKRYATYTNLDPGNYTFKVIGSNSFGYWNDEGTEIAIIVHPPFWKTNWFIALLISISFLILYLGYRLRVRSVIKYSERMQKEVAQRTRELEDANSELETLNQELEYRVEARTHDLLDAKNKAEKADKLKSEFLAQMSHEIRTPINVILNYTDLFKYELDKYFDEMLDDCYEGMKGAGKRIIRTIDLILNMSELQAGSYEFNPKEIELEKILSEMIKNEFSTLANSKGLEVNFISNSKNDRISADEYSVNQICANLIDNAIKYTEKGSVTVTIKESDKKVIVEVADTGVGIEDEYLPVLFEPFSQEEQGYTRRHDGNGLGLALVKKYCEMNGASILVDSKKNEGTTFKVIFDQNVRS